MKSLFYLCLAGLIASVASRIAPRRDRHQDFTNVNSSSKFSINAVDPALDVESPPSPSEPDQVWQKAYCRGATLLKAMSLEEHDSTVMLEWPYTQSPWDGDLKLELRKWGYLDDDDDHYRKSDDSCNFVRMYGMQSAFDALGVDPRSALMGGPNHCFELKHSDGPTVILDEDGKMPQVSKQRYEVDGKMYKVTGGSCKIGVNRNDGIVYFLDRRSPEKVAPLYWGQSRIDKADLPRLLSSSDLAWGMWNRIEGEPKIKMIMSLEVVNPETKNIIIPRALKAMEETKVQKRPGMDIIVRSNDGAEAEAALALISSPNGLGASYFLLQHKVQLGGANFVWKSKIFRGDDDFLMRLLSSSISTAHATDAVLG